MVLSKRGRLGGQAQFNYPTPIRQSDQDYIKRQANWHEQPLTLSHYRDRDGVEVDIVIEKGTRAVAGIEIKDSASVSTKDFRGLKKLAAAVGNRFISGVVLFRGCII